MKARFRSYTLALAVIGLVLFSGCKKGQEATFVEVEGTQFILDGEPYKFVGTNFWYGAYLGQSGANGDRERLKEELDILVKNGITNLRVLGSSEEAKFQNALSPTFINSDGSVNQELLIGLDYLLAEMGKREMKAVIFLNNFWEWSGGMSTWNDWTGLGPLIDVAENQDWTGFMNFSARFYTNEEANSQFRAYIEYLVQRTNTITGKSYVDDEAIMAWQLANEPRPGANKQSASEVPAFITWIDETAAFIKSIDSNHLVSSGNEGSMGSLDSMNVFIDAHDTPSIDYLTFHMWAKNWKWYDAQKADSTFPIAIQNATDYIREHIEIANKLNKPIVMEEFGLGRDLELFDRGTSVTYRDMYYGHVFSKVEEYEALAGTNFWSWGGLGIKQHDDAKWRPGDPFTGDPPQEPQGLNSVFADDVSTLEIIKSHAEHLKRQPPK